jgi:outer membrane protein assembly factor BamB
VVVGGTATPPPGSTRDAWTAAEPASPDPWTEPPPPRTKKKKRREPAPLDLAPPAAAVSPKRPAKNQWDSFRIYGVATLIIVLTLLGGALWYILNRGNASEYLEQAEKAYLSQNYKQAADLYSSFIKRFGETDDNGSLARVRLAMCQLLAAQQSGTDATRVLELINEQVPPLKGETGWEKGDHDTLAGLLMDIGEGMIKQADAEATVSGKEALLGKLATAQQLLQEPEFVPNTVRTKLQTRLAGLAEDRARVLRDINRDRRLAEALQSMEASITARDPAAAYAVRQTLIRDYPRLVDQPDLMELVKRASEVQRELVQTGGRSLKVTREPRASAVQQSLVLTNRQGGSIPALVGKPLYITARGSVLALDAGNGDLMWRQAIGTGGDEQPPIALGESPAAGVLLCDTADHELLNLDGTNGQLKWRASVGMPFAQPTVANRQILICIEDGQVVSLSPESGETLWNTKVPQALAVGAGAAGRGPGIYVTADHSNVYVLGAERGDCLQSYYLGFGPSTVRVPPVVLLGHLFVAENAGVDYALLHILRLDPDSGRIVAQQTPLRLTGNVMTTPRIVGRRLVVITDRNQITVLDVEPTAAGDQVSRVAEQLASDEPILTTQFDAAEGQLWIVGNRLARYELQMAAGKVVRDWVEHEGDLFTTAPQLIADTLFHARNVRGTEGVRVAAVDPVNGSPRWQVDVAVPIAAVAPDPSDPQTVWVVTTQAALYRLDQAVLQQAALNTPLENPGGENRLMRFGPAIAFPNGTAVLLNEFATGQLALFDPKRSEGRLRLVTMDLGMGKPSGMSLACDGGLMIALDNGRVALVDVVTGRVRGTFQPPASPNQTIRWAQPAPVPNDPTQVVLADDQGRIFRLRVEDQIREVAKGELDRKPLGPLAIAGTSVFLVSGGASGDVLARYAVNDLKLQDERTLEGHVTWGPVRLDDAIWLATDREGLMAFSGDGQVRWTTTLGDFTPQQAPVRLSGQDVLLFNGQLGQLVRVSITDGAIRGRSSIGQPISAAPLPMGNRLLVPGGEGTVVWTEIPTEVAP